MNNKLTVPFLVIIYMLYTATSQAEIKLPKLISDGMVLQRDHDIKIWGWGNPAELITVGFNAKKYETHANGGGKWQLTLPGMKAGGPYQMDIKGDNEIIIHNILIGDVWVCSGQSNMEFNMGRVKDKYAAIIAASHNPNIRQFRVKPSWGFSLKNDVETDGWQAADPQTLSKFTAVGYFFARAINDKYKVPVGIINTSFGGSTAEAWLNNDAIQSFPEYVKKASYFKNPANVAAIVKSDKKIVDDWFNEQRKNDDGFKSMPSWAEPGTDTTSWKNITIPGYWESKGVGNIDGVVWFRKEIKIAKADAGKNAFLFLGNIDDQDSTYFNGQLIGSTNSKHAARRYEVPAKLIHEGTNVIVIRIIDTDGPGGFYPDKPYELVLNHNKIPLSGVWRYKIGTIMSVLPGAKLTKFYHEPTALYNNMIHPLTSYAIKGIVWYQGESNTSNPKEYRTLFPILIKTMRDSWLEGDIPFIYVQLPDYGKTDPNPSEGVWAETREVQTEALQFPNTGMAITIGLGEWNDIHPSSKKEVGDRVALLAGHLAYGDKGTTYSGPLFKSMAVAGNKIMVSFDNVGRGLVAKNGEPLHYFAIAGKDKKYVWATAKIDHDKVIVWSDSVLAPVSVRYAWANNPEGANLYNKDGLPASPFRAGE